MKIKQINRNGPMIEVVTEADGEIKRVRRNVLNYDELSNHEKINLHREIAGIPTVDKSHFTIWEKTKALFTRRKW